MKKDLDTSSYQVSDLEDIEFNWEDSQLDMDAVFRPGTDTPFFQLLLTIYRWEDQLRTPTLDEEQDKENSLPPLKPDSVRPTEPPRLQRSCAFGARIENGPDYVCRNLFQ